jgi:hypothetical protein
MIKPTTQPKQEKATKFPLYDAGLADLRTILFLLEFSGLSANRKDETVSYGLGYPFHWSHGFETVC